MTSDRYHNEFLDGAICFWTSSIVDRIPILRSPTAARALLRIWDEYRTKLEVKLVGYVVMPEHIHLAIWSETSDRVERFLELTLSRSSAELAVMAIRAAKRGDLLASQWAETFASRARGKSRVRVWKERGRAFPVTKADGVRQKLNYIHENPVRKGLVERPEDWEFSSAAWYTDGTGPLSIDHVDW